MRARLFLRAARTLMWLTLAAYLAVLAVPGEHVESLVHGLNITSQALPALVCWLCLRTTPGRRVEVAWLAVAASAFAAGNAVLAIAQARDQTLPVPSLADVGYMSFYPAALVAVVLAARREHRQTAAGVWLDSCIGGLAAASATAVLLEPAFSSHQHTWLSTSVSLAYPVGDLLLVFAVVAVAGLGQGTLRPHWLSMLLGLTVFACADVVYDLQIASGGYRVGTPLDALWAVGLAIMTFWAAPAADPATEAVQWRRPVALVVSGTAAAVGLAVLITGTLVKVTPVATVLAAAAIAGSAVRTQQALRHEQHLTELRREAETLERLVQAQDAERARIAEDVHDDSLQALAAVDLRLGALRSRLRKSAPEEVLGVDTVTEAVHEAAGRLRSLMFELEAPALQTELADALRDAATHIFDESETRWTVQERGRSPLPPSLRAAAYRIAREALVNTRKHAAASTVTVTVDACVDGVRVEVLDDGVGMAATVGVDPGRRRSGVVGMRDRASAGGGWWRSAPGPDGVGTLVAFRLPLEPRRRTTSQG